MALTKYASFEVAEVLDLKGSATKQYTASLDKVADFEDYRTGDGYLYVRIRAISSRVNRNHDGWPSVELAGSPEIFERHHSGSGFTVEASDGNQEYGFATFIGKPIFVDHHNSNPKKARGVIVDSKLNVLDHKHAAANDSYWGGHDIDSEHMPPTEVELLLEVDANSFPRLAQAIVSGDLDGFSMGCDVERSKCSHCGHVATSPDEYCSHIVMKGATHDFKTADGKRVARKSYENCYGIKFFEISAVFEPADETALAREVRSAVYREAIMSPDMGMGEDPLRDDSAVADMAMALQMQNRDITPDQAMELAQQKINQEQGVPPGHGEGDVYTPKRWDYMQQGVDNSGMPKPPPGQGAGPPVDRRQYQGEPAGPFGQQAQQLLDEEYPKRPIMNNPAMSSLHTAEGGNNPLPQEMMTRAPDEVDTLRDEQLCEICGNEMDGETCQVCGWVKPPDPFNNPDLDQATKIRDKMKQEEEQQALDLSTEPGTEPGDKLGQPGQPSKPMGGQMPTKAPATASVKSDMRWTPKVHPKIAARINQVEHPVIPSNPPISNEPTNVTVTKDQTRPVTAAMSTAQQLIANAKRNHGATMNTRTADGPTSPGDTSPKTRVDVTGVGGVDEASNEAASKSDAQVDVTGIGTTGISDVEAEKSETLPTAGRDSDDSGFNTNKTTDDSGPTKTFGDSDGSHSGVSDPVTSEPFPASEDGVKAAHQRRAYDDNTLEQNEQQGDPIAQGGSAVQGVEPIDPVGKAQERVNLLDHTTSPSNNSGPTTTWTGTDGNGVLKQQEPITNESQEWGGVSVPDVQLHTTGRVSIAALRLAEAEVELGLISREEKWNRLAELDVQDPRSVQAQLDTLAKVKTAGLAKLAQHRQAGATRMPKAFGKQTAAPHGFERIAHGAESVERQPVSDDVLDSAFFLK